MSKKKQEADIAEADDDESALGKKPQLAYTVEEFCDAVKISKTAFYEEVREKRLVPKKRKSTTLIPIAEAKRWLKTLPDYTPN